MAVYTLDLVVREYGVILTHRYRLLPLKSQHRALERLCATQRELYNAALEERIDCYRKTGKTLTYIDQCKALTECRRELPEMGALPANLQRWTLKRIDDAFQAFFRRVKARSRKAGFPRFRSQGRWEAFGFAEFSGIRFDVRRLRFSGMPGGLKVHVHRPLPESADIRSCVFRRDGRGWHVCLQIAVAQTQEAPGCISGWRGSRTQSVRLLQRQCGYPKSTRCTASRERTAAAPARAFPLQAG